jgi:6-phosphogluconate dehydrogenase
MAKRKKKTEQVVGFLGVGLNDTDGHKRVTRNGPFLLVGGSEETHERLQDISVRFNEALEKRGQALPETPVEEVIDILYEAVEE